jgi:transposase-like protein
MARVWAEDSAMPKPSPIPSYRTRRRWTEKEARAALAALAASRLTRRAFAAREGIDVQRLYSWRRKLAASPSRETVAPPTGPVFVELRPAAPERIEVVLRCGVVLRVSESTDGTAVRRLVDALEPSGSSC